MKLFGRKNETEVNMTEGPILGHIVRFALPLVVGNFFQLFYNTVDTWVVGNYVSNEAFSAVGTVTPIINMLIGIFLGLSNGAGVVISQYFGAGQKENVSKAVHTAMLGTFLLGIVFTVLGIGMTPAMLTIMKTPESVRPEAITYLSIYFGGIIGLMLYNMGTAVLQAVGNARLPFIFLAVCALLNVVLDLVFVLQFGLGVAGVAYATVLSELISAVLVIIVLMKDRSSIQLHFRELSISSGILKKIVRIGFPAALQMGITSFSNVFVQSYINYFGADAMSGWTVYNKMDQLMFLPMKSIALASSTFMGQNLGAGNIGRAKKGVSTALSLAFISTIIFGAPLMLFSPQIVGFFNNKLEVIQFGSLFLRLCSPFYLVMCINQILSGSLRGAGNTRTPVIIMLCSFVLCRQIYLYVMANYISNTIIPIAFSYPAGWIICSIGISIYYRRVDLEKTRLTVN